jgi:hypothetical protein
MVMDNQARRTLDARRSSNVRESSFHAEIMEPILLHWERMKQSLATGWESYEGSPRLVLSAIGFALDFQAWRVMARTQDLSDEQAIELMVGMVRCAAGVGPG